jgi:hypothetical protein
MCALIRWRWLLNLSEKRLATTHDGLLLGQVLFYLLPCWDVQSTTFQLSAIFADHVRPDDELRQRQRTAIGQLAAERGIDFIKALAIQRLGPVAAVGQEAQRFVYLVTNVSQSQLITEILERSVAQTWDEARREWSLYEIYEADEPETCLCGHFPIIELCVLSNRHNGIQATVGNCCVKNFIGLPSDRIFQAIKRIRRDPSNSLNPEAIQHAFDRQWITEWERDFYLTIMRKRNLTEKQSAKKLQINDRVLRHVRRQR